VDVETEGDDDLGRGGRQADDPHASSLGAAREGAVSEV